MGIVEQRCEAKLIKTYNKSLHLFCVQGVLVISLYMTIPSDFSSHSLLQRVGEFSYSERVEPQFMKQIYRIL